MDFLKACRMRQYILIGISVFVLNSLMTGCAKENKGAADKVIVFKHGKLAGDYNAFRRILDRFELENPGIKVKDETLPSSTDAQHQFYVINLEGKSPDIDVLSLDVIWAPEFARAGWLRDLSSMLPPEEREAFFPGPLNAVTFEGKFYAMPWYIDAGLLFFRKDLLQKYGFSPPATWQELVAVARHVTAKEPALYGYIWQGKQYEGLVCNVLEFFWGDGGEVMKEGKAVIDSRENIRALGFMRDLIVKYRITPPLVTTAMEETTRRIFGNGKALFMRNWPYAWNIFEHEGSAVKGRVGMAAMPSFSGKEHASVLGGWQLGVNAYSKHPAESEALVRFLTAAGAQKELALSIGYRPTRKALYRDSELLRRQPFLTELYGIFLKARPRPVTPYYMMITQVMQPEFSAAISGIKSPEEALRSAQNQIQFILKAEQ